MIFGYFCDSHRKRAGTPILSIEAGKANWGTVELNDALTSGDSTAARCLGMERRGLLGGQRNDWRGLGSNEQVNTEWTVEALEEMLVLKGSYACA